MNEIVENQPKWKKILFAGWCLVIAALIIGPPVSIPLFLIGGPMVISGGSLKRRALPPAVPLSQQPAKVKIFYAGIPAILILSLSAFAGLDNPFINALGLFLLAYAVIGLLELKFSSSFTNLSTVWEALAPWKKGLISLVVIVATVVASISIMPWAAKLMYA